jgi:hypothetical protein
MKNPYPTVFQSIKFQREGEIKRNEEKKKKKKEKERKNHEYPRNRERMQNLCFMELLLSLIPSFVLFA